MPPKPVMIGAFVTRVFLLHLFEKGSNYAAENPHRRVGSPGRGRVRPAGAGRSHRQPQTRYPRPEVGRPVSLRPGRHPVHRRPARRRHLRHRHQRPQHRLRRQIQARGHRRQDRLAAGHRRQGDYGQRLGRQPGVGQRLSVALPRQRAQRHRGRAKDRQQGQARRSEPEER